MTDIAIRCKGLGKQYRIGERERYKALRDTISDTVSAPFRWLRNPKSSKSEPQSFWALKDLSFEIRRGEVVGIIGRNGAGKSTLLKILSRITAPTKGEVKIHGRVGSLLEVGTGFHPELTGRENIYLNGAILGMRRAEIERRFDEIVAFAEIEKFLDTPVKRYSSGMYVRLAFAVAAHLEPEVLIVDEVLAVGDAHFQKKCLGKMGEVAKQGRTVLFVSHNMGAIAHLCARGITLENGNISFNGTAQEAVNYYNRNILARAETNGLPAHRIFSAAVNGNKGDVAIISIEILDLEGNPKNIVGTWDSVTFRIRYSSLKYIERASVVLQVNSLDGITLMLLSTQPDGVLPLSFEPGIHSVDCIINQVPLTAGHYVIGAGLAIPGIEYLWRQPNLGVMTVVERDVYGSGLSPTTSRCLLAVEHQWRSVD